MPVASPVLFDTIRPPVSKNQSVEKPSDDAFGSEFSSAKDDLTHAQTDESGQSESQNSPKSNMKEEQSRAVEADANLEEKTGENSVSDLKSELNESLGQTEGAIVAADAKDSELDTNALDEEQLIAFNGAAPFNPNTPLEPSNGAESEIVEDLAAEEIKAKEQSAILETEQTDLDANTNTNTNADADEGEQGILEAITQTSRAIPGVSGEPASSGVKSNVNLDTVTSKTLASEATSDSALEGELDLTLTASEQKAVDEKVTLNQRAPGVDSPKAQQGQASQEQEFAILQGQEIEGPDVSALDSKIPEARIPIDIKSPTTQNPPISLSVTHPVDQKGWSQKIFEKVQWMSAGMNNDGQQVAQIRLDPPDLGPLKIEVTIKNEQAQVVMTTNSAQVKDLLEQNLPRLREMLEGQGFTDVGAQAQNQQQGGRDESSAEPHMLKEMGLSEPVEEAQMKTTAEKTGKGQVDCYI